MEHVTRDSLYDHLPRTSILSATLTTDELVAYRKVGRTLEGGHHSVNHSRKEYVRGRAHVNTAEDYFSQLKRSIDGTHHQVPSRHLPRYLAEFDFRYNTRDMSDGERTVMAVRKAAGKRLMYDNVVSPGDRFS